MNLLLISLADKIMFYILADIQIAYRISIYPAVFCIYASILISRHYYMTETVTIASIRFATLGLLLAGPASCFNGELLYPLILVPIFTILATFMHYILLRLFLGKYSKRSSFKLAVYSNLVVLVPALALIIWLKIIWL